MPTESTAAPSYHLDHFEGPLDLLFHLIEKNRVSVYDIPIGSIADQYISYLAGLDKMDLEIASEFLVMAATLLQIKSRMLLPSRNASSEDDGGDPRDELVMKLLEYRRCKALAADLRGRQEIWGSCVRRLPETSERLGLLLDKGNGPPIRREAFYEACATISERNGSRFNDLSEKVSHLLKRERISIRDKMRALWKALLGRTKALFSELFPLSSPRPDRVAGFLAVLELLKLGRIEAEQDAPFSPIRLEAITLDGPVHDWFDAPEEKESDSWKEYR